MSLNLNVETELFRFFSYLLGKTVNFTLLFLAWIASTALQIGQLSQQNWSQITNRKPPLKYIRFPMVWLFAQLCPVINCLWVMSITECDRRSLKIPTISMAQDYVVGLFQNAMIWKSCNWYIIYTSGYSFNNNCVSGNMVSNVLISADRTKERAGLFHRGGG